MDEPKEGTQENADEGQNRSSSKTKAAKKKSAITTTKRKKPIAKQNRLKKGEKHSTRAVQVSADQLPRRSLEQALRVARALRDTLAGGRQAGKTSLVRWE